MKLIKIICSIFTMAGLLTNTASGQDVSSTHLPSIWSLTQCIDYARNNNISVLSAHLNEKTSEQNLILSKNAMLPNLYGQAGAGLSNSKNATDRTSSVSLNSSLTLFDGNYYRNDIKSKALSLENSKLEVSIAENDIALQITQAYLNILLSEESIQYLKSLILTSEAQVVQAEQKNKTGALANKDVLQLKSSLVTDRYNLTLAENNKRQNLLALKQLLQLPLDLQMEVLIPDTIMPPRTFPALKDVSKKAASVMPEVTSSQLGMDIQDLEIRKAKSTAYPALNLNGSISAMGDNQDYFTNLDKTFNQQIGVTLSVPLFDRKSTRVNVARARIQKSEKELEHLNTLTLLDQKVEQSFISLQNAEGQLNAAEEELKYTKELFRIANEEIRIGAFSNVEYLQQKSQYLQSLQSYTQAKYACILNYLIYNFYNGVPITL